MGGTERGERKVREEKSNKKIFGERERDKQNEPHTYREKEERCSVRDRAKRWR